MGVGLNGNTQTGRKNDKSRVKAHIRKMLAKMTETRDAKEPSLIEILVREEMQRMIGDAKADGGVISASASARAILRTYPTCGFTKQELEDRIMMAAARAGIAVQLGTPKDQGSTPAAAAS